MNSKTLVLLFAVTVVVLMMTIDSAEAQRCRPCRGGQRCTPCGSRCPPTCANRQPTCQPGCVRNVCQCPRGTLLNSRNVCVQPNQC